MNEGELTLSAAASILIVAGAIAVLSASILALSLIGPESLAQSVTALGVALLGLVVGLSVLGDLGPAAMIGAAALLAASVAMAVAAASILVLSASMVIFVAAFKSLATLNIQQVGTALVALAGSLLLLVGAATFLGPLSIYLAAVGVALVVFSAGLVAFIPPLMVLSTMSLEEIARALLALLGAFAVLAVGAAILGPLSLLLGAAGVAMLVFSVALGVFGVAYSMFASLPLEGVASALLALNGAFLALGLAGLLLGPIAPLMMLAALGIISLSGACAIAGVSIQILAAGLNSLLTVVSGFFTLSEDLKALGGGIVDFFGGCVTGIGNMSKDVPGFFDQLGKSVHDFFGQPWQNEGQKTGEEAASGIKEGTKDVADAAENMGDTALNSAKFGLGDWKSLGLDGAIDLGDGFKEGTLSLNDLGNGTGLDLKDALSKVDMTDTGKSWGDQLGNGFNLGVEDLTDAKGNLTGQLVDELNGAGGDFEAAGNSNVDSYIGAFTDSQASNDAKDAGRTLAENGYKAAEDENDQYENVGYNAARGYGDGLFSNQARNYVSNQARNLANASANELRRSLQIRSPSRVTREIGQYGGQGFGLGFSDESRFVTKSVDSLTDNAVDGFAFAIKRINDIVNGDMVLDPTIRPVVDLSNVQNGANAISGLLGSESIPIGGLFDGTKSTLSGVRPSVGVMGTADVDTSSIVNELGYLRGDLKNMHEDMSKMRVELDSGELVGGLVSPMDRQLGIRVSRSRREGRT
jgi:hypothetical protein